MTNGNRDLIDNTDFNFKTSIVVGSVDDESAALKDEVHMVYMAQANLKTSFTGEDELYTRIKTGNHTEGHFDDKASGTYLSATNTNANELKIDKLFYNFPVGDKTRVYLGADIENYYCLAAKPLRHYKPTMKQFANGGNGSIYGSSTTTGFGAVFDAGNGMGASFAYTNKGGEDASKGLLENNAQHKWLAQVAYTKKNYGFAVAHANASKGWADTYFTTTQAGARDGSADTQGTKITANWSPDQSRDDLSMIPSIDVGYGFSTISGQSTANYAKETDHFFTGLKWGKLGILDGLQIGIGRREKATKLTSGTLDQGDEPWAFEVTMMKDVDVKDRQGNKKGSVTLKPTYFSNTNPRGDSNSKDCNGMFLQVDLKA